MTPVETLRGARVPSRPHRPLPPVKSLLRSGLACEARGPAWRSRRTMPGLGAMGAGGYERRSWGILGSVAGRLAGLTEAGAAYVSLLYCSAT